MMAAEIENCKISENINKLNIENENNSKVNKYSAIAANVEYGLPLKEVYKLAFNFYKGTFCVCYYYKMLFLFFFL